MARPVSFRVRSARFCLGRVSSLARAHGRFGRHDFDVMDPAAGLPPRRGPVSACRRLGGPTRVRVASATHGSSVTGRSAVRGLGCGVGGEARPSHAGPDHTGRPLAARSIVAVDGRDGAGSPSVAITAHSPGAVAPTHAPSSAPSA
jgi:hypothetical protein